MGWQHRLCVRLLCSEIIKTEIGKEKSLLPHEHEEVDSYLFKAVEKGGGSSREVPVNNM